MIRIVFLICLFLQGYAQDYPSWIKKGVKVIANFGESRFESGYGVIINEGLILSASQNLHLEGEKITYPKDIILYVSEAKDEPIACLAHAEILALDDYAGLVLLEPIKFTDIYCNTLPEQNFRSLHYQTRFLDILKKPLDRELIDKDVLDYFLEQEWLEFAKEQMTFLEFKAMQEKQESKLLGMPMFINDEFYGIVSQKENKTSILTHKEILDFICGLQKTSIFEDYPKIQNYCEVNY
ncbi:hypothetical protein [Helicobacter burdigaliensis]|uniref:hypothetical protein n=1 Tax=Helicobacter burdigaliensis TaxID=2315334 RepID=UPI000EF6EC2B|nr:hypothetical protein [Helicobacter burdigaliensis]